MKYAVLGLLLLSLGSLESVHSKSHHDMRSRDNLDEPDLSDDVLLSGYEQNNDYNDEMENRYRSYRECSDSVISCGGPLVSKYDTGEGYAGNIVAIPLRVRLAGARATCRDGLQFGGCVERTLNQPACLKGYGEFVRTTFENYWKLGKQLCTDRIDDFAKHWHCVLSLKAIPGLAKCAVRSERWARPMGRCDYKELLDCAVNVYAALPECEAGATDFIREFLPEWMRMVINCHDYDRSSFDDSFQKFLSFK